MNDDIQTSQVDQFLRDFTTSSNLATLRGQIMWDGKPVIDDDDGGTAGVREPRRPGPPPPMSGGAALTFEPEYAFA